MNSNPLSSVASFLSGRLLLEEELPFSLPDSSIDVLQGITSGNHSFYCSRCGNKRNGFLK